MDLEDWAELEESLFKCQLKVIRELLRRSEQPVRKKERRSQMDKREM